MSFFRGRHALFVTLEFADPLFSGNGTYSRSLAHGLVVHGFDLSVVCAHPVDSVSAFDAAPYTFCLFDGDNAETPVDGAAFETTTTIGTGCITIYPVPVPHSLWRRLDRGGPWAEFASGFASLLLHDPRWSCTLGSALAASIAGDHEGDTEKDVHRTAERLERVLVVDWSGHVALRAALHHFLSPEHLTPSSVCTAWLSRAVVYMNYRVFANQLLFEDVEDDWLSRHELQLRRCENTHAAVFSAGIVAAPPSVSRAVSREREELRDFEFYRWHELVAMLLSRHTIALCKSDALMLKELFQCSHPLVRLLFEQGGCSCPADIDVDVLMCPIRHDVLLAVDHLARADRGVALTGAVCAASSSCGMSDVRAVVASRGGGRCFLVCGVRHTPDKNALLFAEVVSHLFGSRSEANAEALPIPLLFGAAADAEYSAKVKQLLRTACSSAVIINEFVGPSDLVFIFTHSLLNLHPSLYDAYGLSIVEAAVCGTPTLLHCPGARLGDALGGSRAAALVDDGVCAASPSSPVGATDLLPLQEAVLGVDFGIGAQLLASIVERLLDPETAPRLAEVSARAQDVARRWTSRDSVAKLLQMTAGRGSGSATSKLGCETYRN